MRDVLKVFSIFTPRQIRECWGLLGIMLLGSVLESVGIGAILPLISLMEQENYLNEHYYMAQLAREIGVTTHSSFVMLSAGVLIALYLLKNAYIAGEIYLQRKMSRKYQILYSRELFNNYMMKPYVFHINSNTATLLRNVNNGATIICSYLLMPIAFLFTEIITVCAIWLMLVVVDFFTAVVVASIMAVIIYAIIRTFRQEIDCQGQRQNDASAEYIKWINQGLGAIKETKVLRREQFFIDEFDKGYEKYANALQRYFILSDMPRIIIESIVVSGLLLLIIAKLCMREQSGDIVPMLGVLALAAFRLMPSANRIVGYYNGIKNQMPFFRELYPELLEIRSSIMTGDQKKKMEIADKMPFEHILEIKNLSYSYLNNKEMIFNDAFFTIPKGEFVGIIGPSGAGKTTFVDIMLGLLQPTTGKILCDGVDINKNIRSWQANLAYVPQDIYLIDGTVKENIALGLKTEDIDDALIDKVLHMAELYDFVNALPQGMETFVGERGVKLSGGQRQRIGIARALYQQPEVLILDEATSALDNETEKSITDTILKLKGQITIIAIAHRVSTLEQCDFKIKFENGTATRVD